MIKSEKNSTPSQFDLNDVLTILFKHKWKLVFSLMLGLSLATGYYFLFPTPFVSEAKLLVRYVVDKSSVDPMEQQVKTSGSMFNETLINAEVEILTSVDLVEKVVDAVTVEKLNAGGGTKMSRGEAVRKIRQNLSVLTSRGSNVLIVSYRIGDPDLSLRVLTELISRYFDKHLEVHRSIGTFDFVTQQTDMVRVRLSQTEEELKSLKSKAGIISLAESATSLDSQIENTQKALYNAEAERAEQIARVTEIERLSSVTYSD